MDIKETAGKIASYIIPFFGTSKTIKQISQEIGEAADNELAILWKSVKGWFIKEYEEETPIDEDFELEEIKILLKKQLKKADDATKSAIEQALTQKSSAKNNVTNNNSKIGQQNIGSTVTNTNSNFNM